MRPKSLLEACGEALQCDGLFGVLKTLNEATLYRYTGIYRFEGRWVKNIWLYDRENPTVLHGSDVRWDDSYCRLASVDGEACAIADSLRDERLITHVARETVQSYVAVLLRAEDGRDLGTLCHYDVRPRVAPPDVLVALRAVRPLIEMRLRSELAGHTHRIAQRA